MIKDLTGLRFGRLLVVSFAKLERRNAWWNCACSCGNSTVVRGSRLTGGTTQSCGCLRLELNLAKKGIPNLKNRTHGLTGAIPEYNSWCAMHQRCSNPNRHAFHRYGGRGIKVCERWRGKGGFVNFLADMGRKPGPEYSVDRKRVNEDYSPDNCKWSTPKEQQNNRGNNLVNRMEAVSG